MDCLFSFQLILLASRAQQQSSTRAGKLGFGADCTFDLLWITLHPSSEAKPLGSDRAPWKTRPVSLEPFLLGVQHCKYSISMPNISDSLLHANPIVSTTRAKGSAKRKCNNPSCVGVLFSLDAPLISRLRWVWLFPEKTTIYAVTRWLARQVGQRETCKAWKNGTFSDRTGSRADLQESFNLRSAFWVDEKFRDFLENPTHETCSKLGAVWDLWPFLRKTQRICGVGPRNSGGERVLTDTVAAANHAILDLSFGVAPVCCHRASQAKRVSGNLGSRDSIIRNTCTEPGKIRPLTNPNGGFVECFLDRVGLGCQFPNIFGLSVPVSRSVMVFPTVVGIEASEPELPGKLTAPYVDRTPQRFPQEWNALRKNMV